MLASAAAVAAPGTVLVVVLALPDADKHEEDVVLDVALPGAVNAYPLYPAPCSWLSSRTRRMWF